MHSWKQKHLACVEPFQRGSACVLAHLLKTRKMQYFSVGLLCGRAGRLSPSWGAGVPHLGGDLTPLPAPGENAHPPGHPPTQPAVTGSTGGWSGAPGLARMAPTVKPTNTVALISGSRWAVGRHRRSLTVLSGDRTGAHRAPQRDQAGSGSGRLPGVSGFF